LCYGIVRQVVAAIEQEHLLHVAIKATNCCDMQTWKDASVVLLCSMTHERKSCKKDQVSLF